MSTQYRTGVPQKGEALKGLRLQDPNLPNPTAEEAEIAGLSASRLRDRRIAFRVAKDGDVVIGIAVLSAFRGHEGKAYLHGRTAQLSRLIIAPEHRGNGQGLELLIASEQAAKELGYGMIIGAFTLAGSGAASRAGWSVLNAGTSVEWLEPESEEELPFIPKGDSLTDFPKAAGLRALRSNADGKYPSIAYKIFDENAILAIATSTPGADVGFKGDLLSIATLNGLVDLKGLPYTALCRLLNGLIRHGSPEEFMGIVNSWINSNLSEGAWIADGCGVALEDLSKTLLDDVQYGLK